MISIEPPSSDALDVLASGLSKAGLSRFLNRARAAVGVAGQVDVLLAGDGTLRRLNRQFRGKNKATDVLSFPALTAEEGGDARLAGDIAISLETAGRQAAAFGHTLRDEVRVLLVHGLLHLHGMDHETDEGEMARRESALRVELGLPGTLIARVDGGGTAQNRHRRNTGVLRFAQDDGVKQATTRAKATRDGMGAGERNTKGTSNGKNTSRGVENGKGTSSSVSPLGITKGKRVGTQTEARSSRRGGR